MPAALPCPNVPRPDDRELRRAAEPATRRLDPWNGSWAGTKFNEPNSMQAVERWCRKIEDVENPATTTAQLQPEKRWEVHPVVDGCAGLNGDDGRPILY